MSGGSYNYLYWIEYQDIVSREEDIENMRDRLAELGYDDLAKKTNTILEDNKKIQKQMNERLDKIRQVWKSVEYYDSSDVGLQDVKEAIYNFKGISKKPFGQLTNRQLWAINYLENYKDEFISPTQLGKAYGIANLNRNDCHSTTGSPILKSLELVDKVERNEKGWYKLKTK